MQTDRPLTHYQRRALLLAATFPLRIPVHRASPPGAGWQPVLDVSPHEQILIARSLGFGEVEITAVLEARI